MTPGQTFTEDDIREMVLRLAHEIRNPLATIQSAVQLLEHIQQPDGETAELYESIYLEVTRVDRVVRDIQRFIRLEMSTCTAVGVAEVVARGVETALDGRDHGSSRVSVQGGPRATVLVDRDQLESALVELLDNALRFTPSDGTVSVSWWLVADGLVGIDVEDEGPGVSEELRDRILRPFFSSSTHGTGLGLNIVSRMCHLLGGRLEWSNRPAAGARFTMILPVLPES